MDKVLPQRRNKSRTFFTESGSALIYVLIAVALFGALTVTLTRQSKNSEAETRRGEDIELAAGQLLTNAAQIDNAVAQMGYTGTRMDQYDFTLPGQAGFNTGSHIHKVFHPSGGGVSLPPISRNTVAEVDTDPPAGWYLGQFNNVEWTDSVATDVVLVAHQIEGDVCTRINQKLLNEDTPFTVSGSIANILVSDAIHGGSNVDLDSSVCPDCEGHAAGCVSNAAGTMFSFYNVILSR